MIVTLEKVVIELIRLDADPKDREGGEGQRDYILGSSISSGEL